MREDEGEEAEEEENPADLPKRNLHLPGYSVLSTQQHLHLALGAKSLRLTWCCSMRAIFFFRKLDTLFRTFWVEVFSLEKKRLAKLS